MRSLLPVLIILFQTNVIAQPTQVKFWGTASTSGQTNKGINSQVGNGFVYSINPDGTGFTVVKQFMPNVDGGVPYGRLTMAPSGEIFGTTLVGGANDFGVMFRLDLDGTNYTKLFDFDSETGGKPLGGMVISSGRLFGVSSVGAQSNKGAIFSLDQSGNDFQKHYEFSSTEVNQSALYLASDNRIYGAFERGGQSGWQGVLFRLNGDGSGFLEIQHFEGSGQSLSQLGEGSNGKLFAILGGRSLISISKDGSDFQVLYTSESEVVNSFVMLPGGKVIGTTISANGVDAHMFKMDEDGANYEIIYNYSGIRPKINCLMQGASGKLYGVAGGGSDVFYEINTDGTDFAIIRENGVYEQGVSAQGLIESSEGHLLGITEEGAASGLGTVYKLTKTGTYTKLKEFPQEGADPESSPTLASDGKLYGCTSVGGTYGFGTIFRIEKDGTGFTTLHNFDGSFGQAPRGRLVEMTDGYLYGTTHTNNAFGSIFRIHKDGNNFSIVKFFDFQGAPDGDLVKGIDGYLYGVTSSFDGAVAGVLYKIGVDGDNFEILIDFATVSSSIGADPSGIIQLITGEFLGLTTTEGSMFAGSIFKTDATGRNPVSLKDLDFSNFNVVSKNVPVQASDGALYGTNFFNNSIYSLSLDGVSYSELIIPNAFQPHGNLVEVDEKLYGVTLGRLFRYDINENSVSSLDWNADPLIYVNGGISKGGLTVVPNEVLGQWGDCNNASIALEGSNTFQSAANSKHWYSFTMPAEDGKKLVIFSDEYANVKIYTGTCGGLIALADGAGELSFTNVSAGQSILIEWTTNYSLLEFDWILQVEDITIGDLCEQPITALIGINHVPITSHHEQWFLFTMPEVEGQKLVISAAPGKSAAIFTSCGYFLTGGLNSAEILGLESSQSVLIKWETHLGGDFQWNLAITDIDQGDNCEYAVQAVLGENFLPEDYGTQYWYKFTMPDIPGKKLVISSSVNVLVASGTGTCNGTSIIAYTAGNGNLVDTNLGPGETAFIRWSNMPGVSFSWFLSVEDLIETDNHCGNPDIAVQGVNLVPLNSEAFMYGAPYWYSFTMPSDANMKLIITSNPNTDLKLYKNSCASLSNPHYLYKGQLVLLDLAPSETVLIESPYRGISFQLTVEHLEEGDNCTLAETITEGQYSLSSSQPSSYWYKFTTPDLEGKRLKITSDSDYPVVVYLDCNNQLLNAFGDGGVTVSNVPASTGLLIKWSPELGSTFSWELTLDDGAIGSNCATVVIAVLGENELPATAPDQGYYWYKFQMPSEEGQKLVISSTTSAFLSIFSACNLPAEFLNGGEGGIVVPNLSPNQEIWISWSTFSHKEGFLWSLTVEPLEGGDTCPLRLDAVLGNNYLPTLKQGALHWYKFTMPDIQGKKLKINAPYPDIVVLYTGNCEDLVYKAVSYDGNLQWANFFAGEEVFILWVNSVGGTGGNYNWSLALEDAGPGESCHTAIQTQLGINTSTSAPTWYKYMLPTSGKLTIQSLSGDSFYDTDLKIFSSCGGELLAANDNFGESARSHIELPLSTAGEEFYILWDNTHGSGEFEWAISLRMDQSITFEEIGDIVFGTPSVAMEASASSGLPITYSSFNKEVASVEGFNLIIHKAGTVTITASQPGNDDYLPATAVSQQLVINKANQVITFGPLNEVTFDLHDVQLQASSSSNLPITFISSDPSIASVNGTTLTIHKAGSINITATQPGNDNYLAATEVTQTLVILKAPQTITFSAIDERVFGSAPFEVIAESSSGLAVGFESSNPQVASIEGNTITIHNAGTVTITANQPGNENYQAASGVSQTLLVTKANQEIAFTTIADKTLGDAPFTLSATASSMLPVVFRNDSDRISITNEIVEMLRAGRVTIQANQAGDENYKPASTVEQTFCINPAKPVISADFTNPSAPVLTSSNEAGNQWYFNDVALPGATAPTYTAIESGSYTVLSTADDCISEESDPVMLAITSLLEESEQVNIYPNPAANFVTVRIGRNTGSQVQIQVVNTWGQVVHSRQTVAGRDEELDTRLWQAGIYWLRLTTEGRVISRAIHKRDP